jgi:tetratricopeptide (TPR) repeat protein
MPDAEKTVFISYRRSTSKHLARSIFMDLRQQGYDVFLDVKTIDSGAFDTIILNQIAARMHFVLVLSPGVLARCRQPDDWLRREIEEAIRLKRNIVLIIEDGFRFEDESQNLPDTLADLPRYNGIPLYHFYFEAAMQTLRERFLKSPAYEVAIEPIPTNERAEVRQRIEQALSENQVAPAAAVTRIIEEVMRRPIPKAAALRKRLAATFRFENGVMRYDQRDYEGAIADYDAALALNPRYKEAYFKRADARKANGDAQGAIADYTQAIQLDLDYVDAYINRGNARKVLGDSDGAIADYGEALRLNPKEVAAYNNRAEAYFARQQYDLALLDYLKANQLKPTYTLALAGLAITYHVLGQVEEAKQRWQHLIVKDEKYRNAKWVQKKLNWADPLVDEARKLIAKL